MTDTTNFDDFEKIQILLKSALNVPSTHEDLPWYSETKGKYDFIIESNSINTTTVPDIPNWDTSNPLDSSTVSSLYGLSSSDFPSDGVDFPRLQTSNGSGGYSTSMSIAPGIYPDTTGKLHLFVRLNLEEALSGNSNSLAYTKYNGSDQLLENSFQFNYKSFDDSTSTNAGQILPYNYTVEYLDGSTYEKMDFSYGNWSFDFKSGIISFSDDPETDGVYDIVTDRTNGDNNLYFTFVKYVGPRGLDKMIDVSDNFNSSSTSGYYENQVMIDSTNNEIYLYKNSAWNSIGGGGGSGGGGSVFTVNGSDAYYNDGNIGIGTTTPSYTLHIDKSSVDVSSTTIYSTIGSGSERYITNSVEVIAVGTDAGGEAPFPVTGIFRTFMDEYLVDHNERHGIELFFKRASNNLASTSKIEFGVADIYIDGNVNIQENSNLLVYGDISFSGTLYQNGVEFTGGGGGAFTVNGSDAYYNDGNVGIGTSSPGSLLDVNGDANISSDLTVGGTADITSDLTVGTTTSGMIYMKSGAVSAYINRIALYGNTFGFGIDGSTLTYHSSSHHEFRYGGSTTSEGTVGMILEEGNLKVNSATMGNSGYLADRRFSGFTHFQSTNNSTDTEPIINITSMSTYNGDYFSIGQNTGSDNGNPVASTFGNMFVVKNSGNVGIGISSPSSSLDVSGTANISSDLTVEGTSVFGDGTGKEGLRINSEGVVISCDTASYGNATAAEATTNNGYWGGVLGFGYLNSNYTGGHNKIVSMLHSTDSWTMDFYTGGSIRMNIVNSGVTINNNLNVGSNLTLDGNLTVDGYTNFTGRLYVASGNTSTFVGSLTTDANLTVGGSATVSSSLTVGDGRQITQTDSDATYGDYTETIFGVGLYTTTMRSYYSNSSYRFFTLSPYGGSTAPYLAPFSLNNNSVFITEQTTGEPALDVTGTANISSDLTVGSNLTVGECVTLSKSSDLSVENDWALDITGTARIKSGVTIGNDGTLNITSLTTGYGSETVLLQTTIDSHNLHLDSGGQDFTNYATSASHRFIMALQPYNGRVGIGTTTPSYTLHVNGDINFTGTLYQNGVEITSDVTAVNALSSDYLLLSSNDQDMNDDLKYYSWSGGGDGTYIQTGTTTQDFVCVTDGYYNISVILHCTDGTANERSMIYGYIWILQDGNHEGTELKRAYLGSNYYRDDDSRFDDIIISGSTLVYLSAGNTFTIVTDRVYSQDDGDDNPADQTVSRLYCEYVSITGSGGSSGTSVFTVNGSDAYYDDGNIGIGTSSPSSTLDVSGTANISSDLTVGGTVRDITWCDESSKQLKIVGGTYMDGDLTFGTTDATNSGTSYGIKCLNGFIIGRVGGGLTDSPTQSNSYAYFHIEDHTTVNIGASNDVNIYHSSGASDTNTEGTIGLTVNSSGTQITDDLTVGGSADITSGLTVGGNFTADGNTTINNSSGDRVFFVGTGLKRVGINIPDGSNPSAELDVSGSANISSDLTVGGSADITSDLTVGGNFTADGNTTINNSSGDRVFFVGTGLKRVGINIPDGSNPSAELDVSGDINFSGSLYQNGTEFTGGGGSVFTVNGSDAYYNDGNIGIGTTTPTYTLHIDKSSVDVSSTTIYSTIGSGSEEYITNTLQLGVYATDGESTTNFTGGFRGFMDRNHEDHSVVQYGIELFVLRGTQQGIGNIQIGYLDVAITGSLKLIDMNDNIYFSSSRQYNIDNQTMFFGYDGGYYSTGNVLEISGNVNIRENSNLFVDGDISFSGTLYQNGTEFTGAFTVNGSDAYYNDGNVGIGTSTPSYTLHIDKSSIDVSSTTIYSTIGSGSEEYITNTLQLGVYATDGESTTNFTGGFRGFMDRNHEDHSVVQYGIELFVLRGTQQGIGNIQIGYLDVAITGSLKLIDMNDNIYFSSSRQSTADNQSMFFGYDGGYYSTGNVLEISGNVNIRENSNLTVGGNADITGDLTVGGDVQVDGNIYREAQFLIGQFSTGATTFNTQTATSYVGFYDVMRIGGTTVELKHSSSSSDHGTLGLTVSSTGTEVASDLTVGGTADITGDLTVGGDIHIEGSDTYQNIWRYGRLRIGYNSSSSDPGQSLVHNSYSYLDIDTSLYLGGDTVVIKSGSGSASSGSTGLTVSSSGTDVTGNLTVGGTADITSYLTVGGNIETNGTDFKFWNATRGGGDSTSNGRALVHASISTDYSKANSILRINYSSDFGAGTRVDSNFGVGITPTCALDVYGDANISSDLTVGGALTVEENIETTNGDIYLHGGTIRWTRGAGVSYGSSMDDNVVLIGNANGTGWSSSKIILRRDGNGNQYGAEILAGLPGGDYDTPYDLTGTEFFAINSIQGGTSNTIRAFTMERSTMNATFTGDLDVAGGQFNISSSSSTSDSLTCTFNSPYNMSTGNGVSLAFNNNNSTHKLGALNYVRSNSNSNYTAQLDIYTGDNGSNALKATFGGTAGTALDVNGDVFASGTGEFSTEGLIVTNRFRFSGTSSSSSWTNTYAQITYSSNSTNPRLYITASPSQDVYDYSSPDSTIGSVYIRDNLGVNGTVTSGSDDYLKKNEVKITNATQTLSKLSPQLYDKYGNKDLSGNYYVESGLIAQEVYYNAPELRHLVNPGIDNSDNEIIPLEMDLSNVDINNDPDYSAYGWIGDEGASLNYIGLIAYLIKSNQELDERIIELETTELESISTLETEVTTLKNELEEEKEKTSTLETEVTTLKNELEEEKEKTSTLETEVTTLKNELEEEKEKTSTLETEVVTLKNELEEEKEKTSTLETEVTTLKNELEEEKEKTSTLETEVVTLKTQMSDLLARVTALETTNTSS